MERILASARRYRWLALAVLAIVSVAGAVGGYLEAKTTYESQATIWVLRPSPELTAANPEDPGLPVIQTVASQQSELLDQLIRTDSFVRDVAMRTSVKDALAAAPDDLRYLDGLRRRFKVETLGTNMFRLSYTSGDPVTPKEMVAAAIIVRNERVLGARALSGAAVALVYRKEFEVAQDQALTAARDLKEFTDARPGTLSPADDAHRAQLQLALDFAQSRLTELRGRSDRAAVSSAVIEMSGLEFQVVDEPVVSKSPRGGEKGAMLTAGIAFAAGLLLCTILIGVGALLADHVAGPADLRRLAPARLFATLPQIAVKDGGTDQDVRTALAKGAFTGKRSA